MKIDMAECFRMVPRSLISLIVLFFITKLIGKKQVSELSLFDYVIGISIGNFTAEMAMNLDNQYINGVIAICIFGITAWLISVITRKSIILRRFIFGVPTLIIQNGKILEKNMKRLNIDINDLLEQSRNNGTFDISQVEYAIMEANGKISFLLKSEFNPVTPKDMNLKVTKEGLVANVIIDGKIMSKNLNTCNKTEEWLSKELKVKGYTLDQVLLATLDNNEKLTIYERNYNISIHNVLE